MNDRDKAVSRIVCKKNAWLASIVLSPHFIAQPRLLAAAAAHLLWSSGFKKPHTTSSPDEPHQAPKRHKSHHRQQHATPHASNIKLSHLHQAACSGDVEQLQALCRPGSGLDINTACGKLGGTALHAAAEAGSADGCSTLLSLGADPYTADDTGRSPLMLAAAAGSAAAVQVLLQAGADPFHVDHTGVNPLMCAAAAGSGPCIQLLLDQGVDADYTNTDLGSGAHALLLAAESGSVAAVRLLLRAGTRVNRTDNCGRTALWAAASKGHVAVVQLLLSQSGVKHIRCFAGSSTTPLEEAQAAHHTACVGLLSAHLQAQQQQQSPSRTERCSSQHRRRQVQESRLHRRRSADRQPPHIMV